MALTPNQLYQQQQQMNGLRSPNLGGIEAANPYMAAAQIATGMYNTWDTNTRKAQGINTSVASPETDPSGKPMYNLGEDTQRINQINPSSFGFLDAASSVGLMGPVNIISNVIGNNDVEKRKRVAQQNLLAAQRLYNSHIAQYNTQQMGQQSYLDNMNMDSRMYNLYKYNSPV